MIFHEILFSVLWKQEAELYKEGTFIPSNLQFHSALCFDNLVYYILLQMNGNLAVTNTIFIVPYRRTNRTHGFACLSNIVEQIIVLHSLY